MLRYRVRPLSLAAMVVVACLVAIVSTVLAASFSGNIASGAQFDLYEVTLSEGDRVTATLVCDFDGVSRPLDPVLSVFFPGSDPSDTANPDAFDDDGFGSDDSTSGVDCDAFDSSRTTFVVPVDGVYTFRADGFGSSTGPYTLSVSVTGADWFDPGDDRINRQAYATAAVYCDADNSRVLVLGINADGEGTEVLSVSYADLPDVPASNVLISQSSNVAFYRLTSSEYQINVGPDAEGKSYVIVWDGCPHTYLNAYTLQNGVMTPAEANPS